MCGAGASAGCILMGWGWKEMTNSAPNYSPLMAFKPVFAIQISVGG